MIKPLFDHVVLEVKEEENVTASGLVITEQEPKKSNMAEVVAVGEGKVCRKSGERIPVAVEVGQTVLFSKYAGTEAEVDGKEYLIVSEKDILAIIK